MIKVLRKATRRLFGHQRVLKKQLMEHCMHRNNLCISSTEEILVRFVRFTERKDISDIRARDINSFRDFVTESSTQYASISSMRAIRCFFRYFKGRKVECVNPTYISDFGISETLLDECDRFQDMKHSTKLKPIRNRNLVIKRITDPIKWSWGALGDEFSLTRESARDLFERHAPKYVTEGDLKRYRTMIGR